MPALKDIFKIMTEKEEREILITGKFPKRYQYLPVNFWGKTDNEAVRVFGDPMNVQDGVLIAKQNVLGLPTEKKTPKIENKIDFGCLYILHADGTALYKIGISKNFTRRFRDICAESPLPIRVVKFAKMDNPHLVESYLHNNFSNKRFKNDWFQLSDNELLEAINFIDKFYNI